MNSKEIIKSIRYQLELEKTHSRFITISRVEEYLDQLDRWDSESIESRRLSHELNIEMFRSVISAGTNAIKGAFLINGGGAVALLSFAAKTNNSAIDMKFIGLSLFLFCVGVFIAALGGSASYITQHSYQHNQNLLMGKAWQGIVMVLIPCSYISFFLGVHSASIAMGLSVPLPF